MSRLPPISRKDLPDHASDERVDRIWGRVREGLPRRPQKGGARGAASAVAAIQARSTRLASRSASSCCRTVSRRSRRVPRAKGR